VHDADEVMSRLTAERLVRHLEMSSFVLMKALPERTDDGRDAVFGWVIIRTGLMHRLTY
jgi:hypothetical protein